MTGIPCDPEHVARALGKARRAGANWSTNCPAHDDRNASLSIGQGDNGKLLIKCHAGCRQQAVIEELKRRGLWPETSTSRASRIIATYDYQDEAGALLFQVVRKHPKRFFQRRPLPGGGWSPEIAGLVRMVLYRLPELVAADPATPVFIAEGEKDVDGLRALGLVATCNPGGAGKWRHDYAALLKGRDVVVLPDTDPQSKYLDGRLKFHADGRPVFVGQDHGQAVAASLHGIARSVCVLSLAPIKDVSDWLDHGGTREELERLAREAQVYQPTDDRPAGEDQPSDDDIDAVVARLARLRPVAYGRVREAEAKALGCRVTDLDAEVRRERGDGDVDDKGQGKPLDLPTPEPWPEPVDGARLIEELVEYFGDHAVLPDRGSLLLALWSIHTHCYAIWRHTPRLHVSAATKRAGKTRILHLLKLVTCKPLSAENITPAAVFRSVAAAHPTLLIDEADVSLRDNPELVSTINGGFDRGGNAVRTVGEDHEPRQFDTFAPVAIAGIGRLPGTLPDRSILLLMRRALRSEQPAKITPETEATAERLSRQIARWSTDHWQELVDAKPSMGDLINRIEDTWTPLYSIALVAGVLPAAQAAMLALTPDDDDADSLAERLLHDIREVFNVWISEHPGTTQHEMTSAEIVERLIAIEGRPWAEMPARNPRPLTPNMMARLLRPFALIPTMIGPEHKRVKGYRLLAFSDPFERHLTPLAPNEG